MQIAAQLPAETFDLRVLGREAVAEDVVKLTLGAAGNEPLPPWEPGAHVDVVLACGLTRQYSLCGDPADRGAYAIAVLREPDGRGGSQFVHEHVHPGGSLTVRPPRNHFKLEQAAGYRFVAGGVGITPILPMVAACDAAAAPWTLHYGGRTRASMAFLQQLSSYGEAVVLHPQDEVGLIDLDAAFVGIADEELVYVCGPEPLISAVMGQAQRLGLGERVRSELFAKTAGEEAIEEQNDSFEVVLARSEITLSIGPGETILASMLEHGVHVFSDCEEGLCGTCEVKVLEGEVDHRDDILTEEERAANESMMVCVSRCKGARLVLDA